MTWIDQTLFMTWVDQTLPIDMNSCMTFVGETILITKILCMTFAGQTRPTTKSWCMTLVGQTVPITIKGWWSASFSLSLLTRSLSLYHLSAPSHHQLQLSIHHLESFANRDGNVIRQVCLSGVKVRLGRAALAVHEWSPCSPLCTGF